MGFPTLGQGIRQAAGDAAKRAMDANGGWEAVNRWIPTPRTAFGKVLLFFGLSYLGATAEKNLSDDSLIGKVIKEVVADTASEVGRPRNTNVIVSPVIDQNKILQEARIFAQSASRSMGEIAKVIEARTAELNEKRRRMKS